MGRSAASELRDAVRAVIDEGQRQWPELKLAADVVAAHVTERLPEGEDPLEAVRSLHAADLYLACACAHRDERALALLEERYMPVLSRYLDSRRALPGFTDEIKQALRVRLLVSESGILPRIAAYNGRGPLDAWLRLTATRLAIDLRRARQAEHAVPADESALRTPLADAELQLLKTQYREAFQEAFAATLAALSAREATVLRLLFLDGLPAAQIGGIYRVSPRTIQRWAAEARQRVIAETLRRLTEQVSLSSVGPGSLMALVRSQLELDIGRLLERRR